MGAPLTPSEDGQLAQDLAEAVRDVLARAEDSVADNWTELHTNAAVLAILDRIRALRRIGELPNADTPDLTFRVLSAVARERARQDRKWGDQRGHTFSDWITILVEEVGETAREALEYHAAIHITERTIRLGRIAEEATQAAATAVAIVEHTVHRARKDRILVERDADGTQPK